MDATRGNLQLYLLTSTIHKIYSEKVRKVTHHFPLIRNSEAKDSRASHTPFRLILGLPPSPGHCLFFNVKETGVKGFACPKSHNHSQQGRDLT